MAACRSCGAQIIWAETVPGGKTMPLNAKECRPSEGGAFLVVPKGDKHYAYKLEYLAERIAIAEGKSLDHGRASAYARYESHLSHFSTCEHADQHRRRAS
jgi:hypothetical protein